jgi:hypothetical protein
MKIRWLSIDMQFFANYQSLTDMKKSTFWL